MRNENNTMETLYRKVAVSERVPKDKIYVGIVNTLDEIGTLFHVGNGKFSASHVAFLNPEYDVTLIVKYWLEEFPDPTAQLQADKEELLGMLGEIKRRIGIINSEPDGVIRETMIDMLPIGIESLIQKHKQ